MCDKSIAGRARPPRTNTCRRDVVAIGGNAVLFYRHSAEAAPATPMLGIRPVRDADFPPQLPSGSLIVAGITVDGLGFSRKSLRTIRRIVT